jgi:hypothetical protein
VGELYATITNGPGYTNAETDRFKDLALRLSLTPFANDSGWLQTFAVSPWFYYGKTASRFAVGGAGQQGPVTEGLHRNRWGVFAGVRDPRLTLGAHYARRTEGFESGNNTVVVPRTLAPDSSGSLISVYAVARPIEFGWQKNVAKLGVVARWDQFTPRTEIPGVQRLIVAGIQLEPTPRTALTLDYQSLAPSEFAGRAPIAEMRSWFLHWSASF